MALTYLYNFICFYTALDFFSSVYVSCDGCVWLYVPGKEFGTLAIFH